MPRSWCIQNPRDLQLLLPTFQNYDVVLAMVCANPRAKTSKNASCFAKFMAIASVDWWCVPHIIQLDKAKIMDLLLLCFQHEKQKMLKNSGFLCHSGGMHCVQQNLKPNQAPSRCWDSMPQVDSGSCKLHGRHNENWWLTTLSTCIRGLTGQSVS